MLVAVCTLKSAIALEHTLVSSSYSRDPGADAGAGAVESLGGDGELDGRQNKLCPVLVPASALEGVLGLPDARVKGELLALCDRRRLFTYVYACMYYHSHTVYSYDKNLMETSNGSSL